MQRNKQVDVGRGILILYIVAVIHGMYWLHIVDGPVKSVLLFEMPCIFILSGYSFALSLRNGLKITNFSEYSRFCLQRSVRILIPYWLYAIVCLPAVFLLQPAHFSNTAESIKTIVSWLNPLDYGRRHSVGVLNSHLWFVGPFLGVTFLIPLLEKLTAKIRIPVWAWLLASAAAVALGTGLASKNLLRSLLAYSIWAMLGYAAGIDKRPLSAWRKQAGWVLLIALACLAVTGFADPALLDMQANKFPPNALFFVFGLAWVALLLIVCSYLSAPAIERLYEAKWLRPFIRKGYSIYLWQGIAYSAAIEIGLRAALPIPVVWLAAVLAALGLGVLASPLESVTLLRREKRSLDPARPMP